MNVEPFVLNSSSPSDPTLPLPPLLSSEAEAAEKGSVSENTIEDYPELEGLVVDEPPWEG